MSGLTQAPTQVEEKLTDAQAEVLQRMLSLYIVDPELQNKIFEKIYTYTDSECELLTETLDKALEKQTEVFDRIAKEDPETAKKIIGAKRESDKNMKKEEEKMVSQEEADDLKNLEEELLKF